jgi:hypothetical protein
MANVRNGNTFYIDAASSGGTAASFITKKNIKVTGVVFYAEAAGDAIVLADVAVAGGAAGSTKLKVSGGVAGETVALDLSNSPIVFPNGIWVVSLDTSCTATLVTSD